MKDSILIVDDEEAIRSSLQGILEDESYQVSLAVDGLNALAVLEKELPDLVLLDIWMPGLDGLETLAKIKEIYPDLAVVMISGHGTIETAVKSTKLGAFDFIEKPLSLEKVLVTVHNAISMSRLKQENASLRGILDERFEIVGSSEYAKLLREQVRIVAQTSAPILICGEKGTGKESVAHAVHRYSLRKEKPFITVNCAAIPEELMESEIFGYEKAAFPGAASLHKGKLDIAAGGTIYFEEVSEMPQSLQHKIRRVIEEHRFERMGGLRPIDIDVRVMASTSISLEVAVEAGTFSEELFFLLNVVPFDLSPLRARKSDIPELVEHFLEIFCKREMREKKAINSDVLEVMKGYDWPGNIRELKNIMERLVIVSSDTIDIIQLPEAILERGRQRQSSADDSGESPSLRGAREDFERQFIMQKLEENDWNITKTAEAIDLERSNLHRKIRSYGIELKK
ncbi:MAG: sigma-54-dependent Fis family transcriptional regulator [Geobacteraceae bacterium]|nr:sigma-54-dependent Fis family transcriptional regulator [Geobacteraceae bacterium]